MELKNFKKAQELLGAIEYAKNTLKKLDEFGTTKFIRVGPVEFVNVNPGGIATDGLKVDTAISGYNSVYYNGLKEFNDRVVSEFKIELKSQIIKLEDQFKNL